MNKENKFQEDDAVDEKKTQSTTPGRVKSHFKMAGATAVFGALLYTVMFNWGASEPTKLIGPSVLERGTVATSGSSLKSAPWILSYAVKVPGKYPRNVAIRTIYARKNACNKKDLKVGETVWLTSYYREGRRIARAAAMEDGCVLQDKALLDEIRKAKNWSGIIVVAIFFLGASCLFGAGIVEWFRINRRR